MTCQERVSSLTKKIRSSLKMSQAELAEALSVNINTIRKWEQGISVPDLENIGKLALVAGYETSDLVRFIEGKGAMPDSSDIELLLERVRVMPASQFFRVAGVVGMRLAEKAESYNFAEAS